MRRVLVLLALSGCATRVVKVAPGVIAAGASELGSTGHAKIYAQDGKVTTIHAKDTVEVQVRQDGDLQVPMKLTLGEMAAGCEDNANGCIAMRVVDQRIVVQHDHYLDEDVVAKGIGFLSVGGLIGFCLAECQDEGSVGRALGYTGAAIAGTALLFVLAVAAGGHD